VPIATSPGRSGFRPTLSLAYHSGSGNGLFGFGWRLSVPSIARKTDKGLPRYFDDDQSDVFILSGFEDLVPAFQPPSTAPGSNTEGLSAVHSGPDLLRKTESAHRRPVRANRTLDQCLYWCQPVSDSIGSNDSEHGHPSAGLVPHNIRSLPHASAETSRIDPKSAPFGQRVSRSAPPATSHR
jgi:Salmonella virulence plasmid 65kDa B protein